MRWLRHRLPYTRFLWHYWKTLTLLMMLSILVVRRTNLLDLGQAKDEISVTIYERRIAVNYIIFPVHAEMITRTFANGYLLTERYAYHVQEIRRLDVSIARKPISYISSLSPSTRLFRGMPDKFSNYTGNYINNVYGYFNHIKSPSGYCRKLIRVGGYLNCEKNVGDENRMDGNKLICIDVEFQLPGKMTVEKPDCLVLSFGIERDTTFDEEMLNMNCEVHMFDIQNYTKEYLLEDKLAHFHMMGIGAGRRDVVDMSTNKTVQFDDLNGMMMRLNLTKRLVNVLKIDIENDEWKVLETVLEDQFLGLFGQIAMEVHAIDLIKADQPARQKIAEKKMKILQRLEKEFGFRRVSYWDNQRPKLRVSDVDGTLYESSGEILLINMNWKKPEFRELASQHGFSFKQLPNSGVR